MFKAFIYLHKNLQLFSLTSQGGDSFCQATTSSINCKHKIETSDTEKILLYVLYNRRAMLCLVAQSCPTLGDPMDYSLQCSSVHGDSPSKNTGVGCHDLLQGIFPNQGSNPGLLHCCLFLYCLSHQGSPLYNR